MTIWLNGSESDLRAGTTLEEAIAATGTTPSTGGVAVAVDGEVVPRSEWETTELRDGQRVEVVQAVQGG